MTDDNRRVTTHDGPPCCQLERIADVMLSALELMGEEADGVRAIVLLSTPSWGGGASLGYDKQGPDGRALFVRDLLGHAVGLCDSYGVKVELRVPE